MVLLDVWEWKINYSSPSIHLNGSIGRREGEIYMNTLLGKNSLANRTLHKQNKNKKETDP
jgi:hypothetical protein